MSDQSQLAGHPVGQTYSATVVAYCMSHWRCGFARNGAVNESWN